MSEPTPPPFRPMPVEPLAYETAFMRPRRPGILTAVGVISIILCCFGLLSNCQGIFMAFMLPSMSAAIRAAATAPSGFSQAQPVMERMEPPQRQIVIDTLDGVAALSDSRKEMLDRLLAKAGADPFPFSGDQITPERVKASVSESGRVPADRAPGENYYIVTNGRIEVGADLASFSPTGGGNMIQVSRNEQSRQPPAPVQNPATNAAVVQFSAMATRMSGGMGIFYGITSVLNLILAIFLGIAGIMLLRGSLRTRRMHLIYAWLKLPTAIAGGIAYGLMMGALMAGFTSAAGPSPLPVSGLMFFYIVIYGGLGCLYPIALLIVMNVRSIKGYFEPVLPAA